MSLQLSTMFSDGIRRVGTRTGGILLVLLLGIQFLVQSSINTVVLGLFPPEAASELEGMLGLTLPVSTSVAGALFLGGFVCSAVYFVVLSRAFTRPRHELSTFPSKLYTTRMGRATLSMIGGGVVVGISVMVGTILFFLPGLFLSVCFLFFIFVVGVEDRRAFAALKRSWGLSKGNRWELAVIVVLTAGIGMAIGVAGSIFDMANAPVLGEVVVNTLSSVLFVFIYGLMAAAYMQVRDDGSDDMGGSVTIDRNDTAASSFQ